MKNKNPLITYLLDCVVREDWHGVSDAANDIRCVEEWNNGYRERGEEIEVTETEKDEFGVERPRF